MRATEKHMETMGIGKIARRAGVSVDTVRYYEKNGLLSPASRLASGYRRYDDLQLRRLRFIREAQKLGFALRDVRELLGLSRQRDVTRVKRAAEKKLADVEARIAALERVRQGLGKLVAACPGHGLASDCPILKALGEDID
jgi:MerR family copper efflux transcriptional regulator